MRSIREIVKRCYNTPACMFLLGVMFMTLIAPVRDTIHDHLYNQHTITVHNCPAQFNHSITVMPGKQICSAK